MRKRKKRSGKSIFKFLVLCLSVVVAFYYFLHSSLFFIEDISVSGNRFVPTEEIIALAGINTGNNIFEFSSKASEKAIEIIPRVKEAMIKRHFPNKVKINIVERTPWAYVVHDNGILLIDAEGICLDKMDTMKETSLPVISLANMPPAIKEGQQVNQTAINLVRSFCEVLPVDLLQQISEYHYLELEQMIVYTLDGTEVRLGGTDRLEEKISLWQRVIKMQNEKGSQGSLEYIDLRFKGQPVIQDKH